MSQPLPPMMPGYSPRGEFWSYNDEPPEALLAPARRAGALLIGLGAVGLIFAFLAGTAAMSLSDAQLAPVIEQVREQQRGDDEFAQMFTTRMLRVMCGTFAVGLALAGLVAGALGWMSRGGRRGWLVASLIFTLGIAIVLGFSLLATLFATPVQSMVLFGLPLGLAISTIRAVLAALRAVGAIEFDATRRRATLHGHGAPMPPGPGL